MPVQSVKEGSFVRVRNNGSTYFGILTRWSADDPVIRVIVAEYPWALGELRTFHGCFTGLQTIASPENIPRVLEQIREAIDKVLAELPAEAANR